jgi:uncharacterized damage-inducible protein DinB
MMMKKALCLTFVLALAAAAAARPALALDHDHGDAKPGGSSIKAEILRQIDDAEKKILQLAEATPAEKYTWRPAEKVRSTGEVFLHVAGANYFLPTLWGAKMPEGVNPREFDKNAGDKAKVIDTVKKSFEHARQAINAASDADLDKTVKIFDREGAAREVLLLIATHAHEHLGQSIAYARMNGIVPPWSA